MRTRDFAFWMVAKLEGKEGQGLSPEEVREIQKVLGGVLVAASIKGGADRQNLPDPEKIGNGLTFKEVSTSVLVAGYPTQED